MDLAEFLGGHTCHGNMRWHVLEHHAAGADASTLANFDVPENFRSGSYQYTRANLWVAVAAFLPRAPQCDLVQDGDVVLNYGGFTGHETGGMVEQDALTDSGSGMNIDCVYSSN